LPSIPESLINRHKTLTEFVNSQTSSIDRSTFWQKRSPQFSAVLTPNGYENRGEANNLPELVGNPSVCGHRSGTELATPEEFIRATRGALGKINQAPVFETELSDDSIVISGNPLVPDFLLCKAIFCFSRIIGSAVDLPVNRGTVLEIGAGSGTLAALMYAERNDCVVIIDLPEMILVSSAFLMTLFPGAQFSLPHEISGEQKNDLSDNDFVFLFPDQVEHLADEMFDLALNLVSFMEMKQQQVNEYFSLVGRTLRTGGYFFSSNRDKGLPLALYPWHEFADYIPIFREPNWFMQQFPPWSAGGEMAVIDDLRKKKF